MQCRNGTQDKTRTKPSSSSSSLFFPIFSLHFIVRTIKKLQCSLFYHKTWESNDTATITVSLSFISHSILTDRHNILSQHTHNITHSFINIDKYYFLFCLTVARHVPIRIPPKTHLRSSAAAVKCRPKSQPLLRLSVSGAPCPLHSHGPRRARHGHSDPLLSLQTPPTVPQTLSMGRSLFHPSQTHSPNHRLLLVSPSQTRPPSHPPRPSPHRLHALHYNPC